MNGLVVGAGRPIAGAQVLYTTRDGDALAVTTSDTRGNFELAPTAPLEDGLIVVLARGYAPLETGPHAIRRGERRFVGNLQVSRGVMLRGLVTGPSGTALAGARVNLREGGPGGRFNQHVQEATADIRGEFQFPSAPLGTVRVEAHAAGHGSRMKEMQHSEATDRITILLAAERALLILTRDLDGAGIAGAKLYLRPHDSSSPASTAVTDEAGTCSVAGLGSEVWEVRVDAAGYRPAVQDRVVADGNPVVIELAAWPCIRGRVVAPAGAALPAGTTVVPLSANARGAFLYSGVRPPLTVGPDGSFEICDLRPGIYVARAQAQGFARSNSPTVRLTLGANAEDVTIELRQGGSLDLAVQVEEKARAAAAVGIYDRSPPLTELYRAPGLLMPASSIAPLQEARTGADGHVQFEHLARGQYWLLIRADGHLSALHGPVFVEEGRLEKTGPVRLETGGRLFGEIAGLPPDVRIGAVTIFGEGGVIRIPIQVSVDEDGAWTSPSLPAGTYRLSARATFGQPPRALIASSKVVVQRGEKREVRLVLE